MEDLRSKSYNGMQIQAYNSGNFQDFRCYSASHASSSSSSSHTQNQSQMENNNNKFKKNSCKSTNGNGNGKNWSLSDPELQRKKRVASYKAYTVEGKVKGSIKKSFKWIKDKYSQMVYGFRS